MRHPRPGAAYNIADDDPAPRSVVMDFAADLLQRRAAGELLVGPGGGPGGEWALPAGGMPGGATTSSSSGSYDSDDAMSGLAGAAAGRSRPRERMGRGEARQAAALAVRETLAEKRVGAGGAVRAGWTSDRWWGADLLCSASCAAAESSTHVPSSLLPAPARSRTSASSLSWACGCCSPPTERGWPPLLQATSGPSIKAAAAGCDSNEKTAGRPSPRPLAQFCFALLSKFYPLPPSLHRLCASGVQSPVYLCNERMHPSSSRAARWRPLAASQVLRASSQPRLVFSASLEWYKAASGPAASEAARASACTESLAG